MTFRHRHPFLPVEINLYSPLPYLVPPSSDDNDSYDDFDEDPFTSDSSEADSDSDSSTSGSSDDDDGDDEDSDSPAYDSEDSLGFPRHDYGESDDNNGQGLEIGLPRPNPAYSGPMSRPVIDLTEPSPVAPRHQSPPRKKRRITDEAQIVTDGSVTTDGEDSADEAPAPKKPGEEEEKPKKLAGIGCIICMEDEPVDLSVTPCGHLFCNKCLFGAIKSTLAAPHKVHGKCPVCRGKVSLKDIIVLEIKKKSKGKERAQ